MRYRIFCRKAEMARIDKIHKGALGSIYNNFDLSLEELLLYHEVDILFSVLEFIYFMPKIVMIRRK